MEFMIMIPNVHFITSQLVPLASSATSTYPSHYAASAELIVSCTCLGSTLQLFRSSRRLNSSNSLYLLFVLRGPRASCNCICWSIDALSLTLGIRLCSGWPLPLKAILPLKPTPSSTLSFRGCRRCAGPKISESFTELGVWCEGVTVRRDSVSDDDPPDPVCECSRP